MTNFFSNFDVIVAPPAELENSCIDIEARRDELGGYTLLVNRNSDFFRTAFGEQQVFTKFERRQIKLFAIGVFLKRHAIVRRKYLPDVQYADEVEIALARLAEEALETWEM